MNERSRKIGRTITKIAVSQKKKKIIVFFGEDKIEVSQDVFSDHYLYVGKELTEKEYKDFVFKTKQDSLYQYALSIAIKGCYSTYEIIQKLKAKATDGQSIKDIIARLKKCSLLDDKQLAVDYKELKEAELYGELRIKDDLLHKKVIDTDIVGSLRFNSEKEHAKKAAELIEKKLDKYPYNLKISKAIEMLERRGFTCDIALKAVEDYKKDQRFEAKQIKITGETLLKRYKCKYEGYNLRQHMFVSLARKGYETDLIKQYLEEVL